MNDQMSSLSLTERIAEAVAYLIMELPDRPLDKEMVAQQCEGVTTANAQKNLTALRHLGIIDQGKYPTLLGKRWANPSLREEATKEAIEAAFPPGIDSFSLESENNELVPWLVEKGGISKEVAKKNAAVFRTLIRFAESSSGEKKTAPSSGKAANQVASTGMRSRSAIRVPLGASDREIQRMIALATANGLDIVMY